MTPSCLSPGLAFSLSCLLQTSHFSRSWENTKPGFFLQGAQCLVSKATWTKCLDHVCLREKRLWPRPFWGLSHTISSCYSLLGVSFGIRETCTSGPRVTDTRPCPILRQRGSAEADSDMNVMLFLHCLGWVWDWFEGQHHSDKASLELPGRCPRIFPSCAISLIYPRKERMLLFL